MAPIDLMFQSIAGSQKGNEAFGLNAQMLQDGREMMLKKGTSTGPKRHVLRDQDRVPSFLLRLTMAGIR